MRRATIILLAGAMILAAFGGVALAEVERGTPASDLIGGTKGPDKLYGLGGNDIVVAFAGDDKLYGGTGNDDLDGMRDDDALSGQDGTDTLDGGLGTDSLQGGEGGDYIFDGPREDRNRDTLNGGEGNDVLFSNNRPAARDNVSCGPGFDTVEADSADRVAPNCERVKGDGTTPPDSGGDLIVRGAGGDTHPGGVGDYRLDGRDGRGSCRADKGDAAANCT